MPAELLRRAAKMLRDVAGAATPGPWVHVDHGKDGSFMGCGQVITWGEGVEGGDIAAPSGDLYSRGGYSPRADMSHVALMHPPMALALADYLEVLVEVAESETDIYCPCEGHKGFHKAVNLARAILREDQAVAGA